MSCPGLHFHFAAYNIRFRPFRVLTATNPITSASTSAKTHRRYTLHIPCGARASPSRPWFKSTARVTDIPNVAVHTPVRAYPTRRLGKENVRGEPRGSALEMRRIVAWCAAVVINTAGNIQRRLETLMTSAAKTKDSVDTQRDMPRSVKSGYGRESMGGKFGTRKRVWFDLQELV